MDYQALYPCNPFAAAGPRVPVRIGTYRGLPRDTRWAWARNDLILGLGVPFLGILLDAQAHGEAVRAGRQPLADKRRTLAAVWFGKGDAAPGFKARLRSLFPDGRLDLDTARALVEAQDLVWDALAGRRLFAPLRARSRATKAVRRAKPPAKAERGDELTWAELVRLEPRLRGLLADVRAGYFGRYPDGWYHGLRTCLSRLVGWTRDGGKHPILGTAEAFDVAGDKLLAALPRWRGSARSRRRYWARVRARARRES